MTISSYQVDGILKYYSKMNQAPERRPGPGSPRERDYDRVTLTSPEKKSSVYDKISQTVLDTLFKQAGGGSNTAE